MVDRVVATSQISGPLASRPTYPTRNGQLYMATDPGTPAAYIGVSTDWLSITAGAPIGNELDLDRLSVDLIIDKTGGNLEIAPSGDLLLNPGGDDIYPTTGYKVNLGLPTSKLLGVYAAELHVETLVAEETMAAVGGRFIVPPSATELIADLPGTGQARMPGVIGSAYAAGTASSTSVIVSVPSYTKVNDVMFAQIVFRQGGGTVTCNTPLGWTDIRNDEYPLYTRSYLFSRVATIIDEGLPTYTWTLSATSNHVGQIVTVRGLDASFINGQSGTSGLGSVAMGSVTSTVNDCLLLFFGAGQGQYTFEPDLEEMTEYVDAYSTGGGTHVCAESCSMDWSVAGDSGPVGSTVNASTRWVAQLLALAPEESIDVKHNSLSIDDTLRMEGGGNVEWMLVLTEAQSVTGGYRYRITRNRDGTGANDWYAGDAVINTGGPGDGMLDEYALRSVKSASHIGPAIVAWIRNSTAYGDINEGAVFGNLNGLYGYGSTAYGAAFGLYGPGTANLTIDPTNGIRFRSYQDTILQIKNTDGKGYIVGPLYLDTGGGIYQGSGSFGTPTTGLKIWNEGGYGKIADYNGGTPQWYAGTAGIRFNALSGASSAASLEWWDTVEQFALGTYVGAGSVFGSYIHSNLGLQISISTAGQDVEIQTQPTGMVKIYYDAVVGETGVGDLRVAGGLYVGDMSVDPTAGVLTVKYSDAGTANVAYPILAYHATSGTPAANFGVSIVLQGDTTTGEQRTMGDYSAKWATATEGSQKATVSLGVYDTVWREFLRGQADGTQARIGVLGATPIARQAHTANPTGGGTIDTQARIVINTILAMFEDFGFMATS
jgi:hypothetical protein